TACAGRRLYGAPPGGTMTKSGRHVAPPPEAPRARKAPRGRRETKHPTLLSWHCAPPAVPTCHRPGFPKGGGPGGRSWGGPTEEMDDDNFGGGGFGVRRPLRFLAHKLDLDERQVAELARILDELKTERAQAEVDRRRTVAAFADALSGDAFNAAK